ncbi:uncharacterized protein LOC107272016 [Cephus cinctus]|uniref:Uncharacterized protein LOC107272016 n=1 Tax=Cephus cinctus TaxID=211228 RepID=A0AAJ7C8S4_CEPCN|nr:uncharacterized protein LOC107272016 [Cephus cinctus]
MAPTRVILMSCGSYNPPTNMHLRMFEIARDHFHRMGTHIVVGGVISPVHDAYAKKDLASAMHRCAMLKLALQNNDWIRVSSWETRQNAWIKTRISLQHHQNLLNAILFDTNNIKHHTEIEDLEWIPENVKNSSDRSPIQIKLLCGADLLESFGTPGLWADEDIDAIVGQHGLVVITREGSNPNKFIYDSDILSKYMYNIHIVTEWIPNEVSSTRIRRALKRGESVKYLVQDLVIDYIYKHGIYNVKSTSTIKLDLSLNNANNYLHIDPKYQNAFLTPSPSDITMESPSPIEIISIDVPDSVLKKNLQNTPSFTSIRLGSLEDVESVREKFFSAISENGNKLLPTLKIACPGQAKQIIATETGESQILNEVGLSEDARATVSLAENIKTCQSQENESCLGVDVITDDTCEVLVDLHDPNVSEKSLSSEIVAILEDQVDPNYIGLEIDIVDKDSFEADSKSFYEDARDDREKSSDLENDRSSTDGQMLDRKDDSFCETIEEFDPAQDQFPNEVSPKSYNHTLINIIPASIICSDIEFDTNKNLDKDITLEIDLSMDSIQLKNKSLVDEKNERLDVIKLADGSATNTEINEIISTNREINTDKNLEVKVEALNKEHVIEKDIVKSNLNSDNPDIDGKYIKSLVNLRKSPKKLRNKSADEIMIVNDIGKVSDNDNVLVSDKSTITEKLYSEKETSTTDSCSTLTKSNSKLDHTGTKRTEYPKDATKTNSLRKRESIKENLENSQRQNSILQGSLDSINITASKASNNSTSFESVSKKSKSFESIKHSGSKSLTYRSFEISYSDIFKLKSDSTSQLITANNFDGQSDEFCTECCYANDPSLKEGSLNQDLLYTLRSNGSSPVDEDSTECDICSACDLQDTGEVSNYKTTDPTGTGCELCEICGEANDDFIGENLLLSNKEPLKDILETGVVPNRKLALSLLKDTSSCGEKVRLKSQANDSFEIENCGVDYIHTLKSDNDHFEIENCGADTDLNGSAEHARCYEKEKKNCNIKKSDLLNDKLNFNTAEESMRNLKYFMPKDEVVMMSRGNKRLSRKGSFVQKGTVDHDQEKRRYSSVDNLQYQSKQFLKTSTESKFLRSKGTKLIASADNIRSDSTRSKRGRRLQRSADDIGKFDSSADNLDSLDESLDTAEDEDAGDEINNRKARDNDMVKMILTKHGIKIISEKETVL